MDIEAIIGGIVACIIAPILIFLSIFFGMSNEKSNKKKKYNSYSNWVKFAQVHGLQFTNRPISTPSVIGIYRGYNFKLTSVKASKGNPVKTVIHLTLNQYTAKPNIKDPNNKAVQKMIAELLIEPDKMDSFYKQITMTFFPLSIKHSSKRFVTNPDLLHNFFEGLSDLADVSFALVALGGEALVKLETIQNSQKLINLQTQLVKDICTDTTKRLKEQFSQSICPNCFTHFGPHTFPLPLAIDPTYYACRTCRQSRKYLKANPLIATLNNQMTSEFDHHDQTLHINALLQATPFDFDEVHIIQATDEQVERFAVQIGNDTDPLRKPCYKQIDCIISPSCELSENTVRILRQIFGRVVVGDGQEQGESE